MTPIGRLRRLRKSTWFRPAAALGLALTVTAVAWGGLTIGAFGGFVLRAEDALFPAAPVDPRIEVVGIDSRAILGRGERWPWPRTLQATLVRQITRAQPRLLVLDILYSPPDQTQDPDLAAAIREAGPVVLASVGELRRAPGSTLLRAVRITPPSQLIEPAGAGAGLTNVTPDATDGVVRALPLVALDATGRAVPSLALAAFLQAETARRSPLILRPHGVQVGREVVPAGRLGLLALNYADSLRPNRPDEPYLSALDVLSSPRAQAQLKGKVVLVGVADPTLGDYHLTPVDKSGGVPGVFVQANAVNTMLTGAYLRTAPRAEVLAWVFVLAFLVALAVLVVPLWLSPLAMLIGVAGYLLLVFNRFDRGLVLDPLYPPVSAAVAYVAALVIRYLTEVRKRRRVSSLFAQYVPDVVVRQLVDDDRAGSAVAGERAEVTVLFCDLRGFTATAAAMSPPRVRDMLNVYYEHASRIVFDQGGTLMNYVGDEVFAVFGAPVPRADHAEAAFVCAVALQNETVAIASELDAAGLPPIRYGIGLNSGDVVAAHVGSALRRQYTVLGDTVNVGSRLCSVAGPGEIVLSERVRQHVADPPTMQELTDLALRGVSPGFRAYRLARGERETTPPRTPPPAPVGSRSSTPAG